MHQKLRHRSPGLKASKFAQFRWQGLRRVSRTRQAFASEGEGAEWRNPELSKYKCSLIGGIAPATWLTPLFTDCVDDGSEVADKKVQCTRDDECHVSPKLKTPCFIIHCRKHTKISSYGAVVLLSMNPLIFA